MSRFSSVARFARGRGLLRRTSERAVTRASPRAREGSAPDCHRKRLPPRTPSSPRAPPPPAVADDAVAKAPEPPEGRAHLLEGSTSLWIPPGHLSLEGLDRLPRPRRLGRVEGRERRRGEDDGQRLQRRSGTPSSRAATSAPTRTPPSTRAIRSSSRSRRTRRRPTRPWPYEYGESTGAPRYDHLPTRRRSSVTSSGTTTKHLAAIRRRQERRDVDKGSERASTSRPRRSTTPASSFDFNALVREERRFVAPGSTLAWTRAFDVDEPHLLADARQALRAEGSSEAVSEEAVPRRRAHRRRRAPDRVLPRQGSTEVREEGDAFVETGASFPRLAWVALTGNSALDEKKVTFVETPKRPASG